MTALLFVMILLVGFLTVPRRWTPPRRRRSRKIPRLKPRRKLNVDMGMVLTEVATRLRSGSTVERAWEATLNHHEIPGPHTLTDDGVPSALLNRWKKAPRQANQVLPATFAVCRMGAKTGAPMAAVLDACAGGITDLAEAQAARDIALAGPRASARMLAALPLVGLGFGALLGADPIGFFATPYGILLLIAGVALELAGIVWVRKMVNRAKEGL